MLLSFAEPNADLTSDFASHYFHQLLASFGNEDVSKHVLIVIGDGNYGSTSASGAVPTDIRQRQ